MRTQKGQGLVEFALMLPIVLLMLYGLIELARLVQASITVQHAAREGARYAVTGQSITGVAADRASSIVTKTRAALAGLQVAPSADTPAVEPNTARFYADVSLNPTTGGSAITPITVTVTYNYSPLVPISFNGITLLPTVLTLQGRAVMITERIDKVTPVAEAQGGGGGTYSISGSITGVSGVTITITSGGTGSATTDASGNYTLSSLNSGTYTITPGKAGCTFTPTSLTVTITTLDSTGNNFTPSCSGYTISGSVGTTGATVTLSGAGSGTATSDGAGNYSFSNQANGAYTITPGKAGCTFNPTSINATISGADSAGNNFSANCPVTTYSISGTVTGATGVTMTLSGSGTGTATTDGSGNYSFSGLSNGGTYTVTPSGMGCTFSPSSRSVTISSADSTGNNFTCSYSISGYTRTGSGAAISGVAITASGTSAWSATTNGSGYYSQTGLSSGSYSMMASLGGYTFSPNPAAVTISGSSPTQDFTGTTSGCAITATAITISSDKASLNFTNGGSSIASITNIDIAWPSSNTKLKEVKFKTSSNEKIWDAGDTASPTGMPAEGGWKSSGDRTLGAGSTKTLEFKFEDDAASTGYTITVTFDNGCSLTQTK